MIERKTCELLECENVFERSKDSKTRSCSRSHAVKLQYQDNPQRRELQALNTSKTEVQKKKKKTSLNRHGVESFSNFEKRKQTMLKNHGVETSFHLPEVQEKAKKTMLKKYGYENLFYSNEFQKLMKVKSVETLLKNYGVTNPSQIPGVTEKIYKAKETNFKNRNFHSIPEINFTKALEIKPDFILGRSIDGLHEDSKIILEYDGEYYHSPENRVQRDKESTLMFLEAGYSVVRIREHSLPSLDISNSEYLEIFVDKRSSYNTESEDFLGIIKEVNAFIQKRKRLL